MTTTKNGKKGGPAQATLERYNGRYPTNFQAQSEDLSSTRHLQKIGLGFELRPSPAQAHFKKRSPCFVTDHEAQFKELCRKHGHAQLQAQFTESGLSPASGPIHRIRPKPSLRPTSKIRSKDTGANTAQFKESGHCGNGIINHSHFHKSSTTEEKYSRRLSDTRLHKKYFSKKGET